MVNGTSSPRVFAIPIAIAVLPVPGYPPMRTAQPAIVPSWTIFMIIPAALLASSYPTIPCEIFLGSNESSRPRPKRLSRILTSNVWMGTDSVHSS